MQDSPSGNESLDGLAQHFDISLNRDLCRAIALRV